MNAAPRGKPSPMTSARDERPPARPEESLAGLIERVTFHSDETGFSVLRVKARGHRDLVTVVGTTVELSPGEWIEAQGAWQVDPRHGPQFRTTGIRTSRPDTREGIEKYLGSGMIRGIGPHFAAKLVRAFGEEVFDVIEKRSARLLEVEGIGPGRREAIKAAWNEQQAVRGIMTFLFSHGVSAARAHRIYRTYGEEAAEKIRLDPYCLARDIRGIGFQTADRIAERVGIARDDELRARAGVEYALLELAGSGHCAYPRADLVETASQMLEIEPARVEEAVRHGLDERRLALRETGQGPLVYLAPLDASEGETARRLADLAAGPPVLGEINVEAALDWVQQRIELRLDPGQREAVAQALRSRVSVITGGPGVGKTTLVRALVRIYRAKRKRLQLAAPTGRAAKRLAESTGAAARTIHRMLVFEPATGEFRYRAGHPLPVDVLIVDESSMLDIDLACKLLRAVPPHAGIVFVGDVDQLPSVGPGCVLRDVIDSGAVSVSRLTRIFRQAERSHIVANAHRINEGVMPEFPEPVPGAEPGDFFFVGAEEPARAVERIVQLVRRAVPRRFRVDPVRDIQVLTPMQRGELGARNLNRVLQQALNPEGPAIERFGVLYRAGDKVMQTQNDYDKDVYNGDIGVIARIDEEGRQVHVRFEGRPVVYDFSELDELMLSYAVTIHKSQGSEYPCVIVPMHTQHYVMLQRNLIYTAVTRGRRLVVVVGTKKAVAIAVQRGEAGRRVTALRERLADEAHRAAKRRGGLFA